MFKLDYITNKDIKKYNSNLPKIPEYGILIVGGSRFGQTNALPNLTNSEPDMDKVYLFVKDSADAKYQFLIKKKKKYRMKIFK